MPPLLPTLGQVRLSELHDALCTAEIWERACLLDFWLSHPPHPTVPWGGFGVLAAGVCTLH